MSNKNSQLELHILQAIAACGYDSALTETKTLLLSSLGLLEKVNKRKARKLAEAAGPPKKTQHQQWWDMIKENAAKNAAKQLDELDLK